MSAIDDRTRLQHMLEAAQKIVAFSTGKTRDDFAQDEMLQLSVVRLVEIIGEAAARISDELKQRHSSVPWTAIVGMRNRLVHAYFDIDLDVVWDTVTLYVPEMIRQITEIIEALPNEDGQE